MFAFKMYFQEYYIGKTGYRLYLIDIYINSQFTMAPGSHVKDFRIKKFSFEV